MPSLRRALWIDLVGLRAVILLLLILATNLGGLPAAAFLSGLIADTGILIWQVRRLQRSADDYMLGHGGQSRVWGSYLICLFLFFAWTATWWGLYLISFAEDPGENFADMMDRLHAEKYSLTVSEDGRRVYFDGEVTHGLTRIASALMREHTDLKEIHLISNGGHVYEARGMAQLINEAGLTTIAQGKCASTCTLLLIAGRTRQLGPEGQLGFHQYALDSDAAVLNLDPKAEQEKDRAFFRAQGVSEEFANRIYDAASDTLWYPDMTELKKGGVLTPP
ncbi:MAG: hypothetical protein ACU0BB_01980 [Paracoccaceae bacterium]